MSQSPKAKSGNGAFLNRVSGARPQHDVHQEFIDWASGRIVDDRERALFARMAARCGIERRWSVLGGKGYDRDTGLSFFGRDATVSTGERMGVYAREAPELALAAIARLGELGTITHIVVASCTGFVAPGIDQIIARRLGLGSGVERVLVGFMGCYAGITALRVARHIVRSEPQARVLVVTVELCTLHLQPVAEMEKLLAMLQFGDGAAAAIVSSQRQGLELTDPFALALPDSEDLITWQIGDYGFAMHLSGEVPGRIADALADDEVRRVVVGNGEADSWVVHAGGRSILDAVARGLDLPADALNLSREVLTRYGNVSSSTILFVFEALMARGDKVDEGHAMAFGPGLAVEGLGYRSVR